MTPFYGDRLRSKFRRLKRPHFPFSNLSYPHNFHGRGFASVENIDRFAINHRFDVFHDENVPFISFFIPYNDKLYDTFVAIISIRDRRESFDSALVEVFQKFPMENRGCGESDTTNFIRNVDLDG